MNIGTNDVQEIIALVPVKDSKKYKIWWIIAISIPDTENKYIWKISHIAPATDFMTKKVQIKIEFDLKEWETLPYGTYTKVNIPAKTHTGLSLASSFIQYDFSEPFVFIQNWIGELWLIKKPIISKYCSDTMCIIGSWLKVWDTVVRKTK